MRPKFSLFFIFLVILLVSVSAAAIVTVSAQQQRAAFEPIDHAYIYDINGDGSVLCTWSTTILPNESTILYTFSFRGGEVWDFEASDSLGQELDVDVNEEQDQRTVTLLLAGYQVGTPYQFNLSFFWDGLVTRNGDRHTLFTSANVGEPQGAKVVVIPPSGATLGVSTITRGELTEAFQREPLGDRTALVWETPNTGNETEMFFRANYRYQSALLSLQDNLTFIIIGGVIVVVGALLLGYRKKLTGAIAEIKKRV